MLPSDMIQKNREAVDGHFAELLREISADDFHGDGVIRASVKGGRIQEVEIITHRKKLASKAKKTCDESQTE